MGVQLVNPDATVACVTGEASIQMCIQELSTCKQYHLPIKIVNLNNRYMGMVRQWQEFFYGNRYAESYMDALPDFVKLAEAYGHVGIEDREAGRRRGRAEGGVRAEGPPRVPRLHHRPDRERLPDGARRQGPLGDDPLPRSCSHAAHPFDPRRERGRRAVARLRAVLRPRLQHRVADRRADRGPDDVAHDHRHHRLRRGRSSRSPSSSTSWSTWSRSSTCPTATTSSAS